MCSLISLYYSMCLFRAVTWRAYRMCSLISLYYSHVPPTILHHPDPYPNTCCSKEI